MPACSGRPTLTWPSELGQVYPKTLPPLRTDRDTIVIGAVAEPLNKSLATQAQFVADRQTGRSGVDGRSEERGRNATHSCRKVVQLAKADDGITLPSVGSAGLAETGRIAEASVDGLTDLAERAVATGDVQAAQVAAQAVLARDPGNIKAKTVQRVVDKKRTEAKPVAQATTAAPDADERVVPAPAPAPGTPAAAPAAAPNNELNLVRPAVVPPQGADALTIFLRQSQPLRRPRGR